jgi:hypothetical protein
MPHVPTKVVKTRVLPIFTVTPTPFPPNIQVTVRIDFKPTLTAGKGHYDLVLYEHVDPHPFPDWKSQGIIRKQISPTPTLADGAVVTSTLTFKVPAITPGTALLMTLFAVDNFIDPNNPSKLIARGIPQGNAIFDFAPGAGDKRTSVFVYKKVA